MHRRAVIRVLLLHKIVNGLVAIDPGDILCKQTRKSRHVKSHAFKKIQCKTESHRLSLYENDRTMELTA